MIVLLYVFGYNMVSMSDQDLKKEEQGAQTRASDTGHAPRPVTPEDESYRELMMRFTAHPVKPKYWFEEFGDHWTCSCGQINKGETCSNCGLERALLRQLFILHKPSADGTPSAEDAPQISPAELSAALNMQAAGDKEEEPSAQKSPSQPAAKGHKGLVTGVIIASVLILLGAGAFLYFVFLPQMHAQDAAKRDSVRISLSENLSVATTPMPTAQYKAYIPAGDMLVDKGKYSKSLTYYNKAADLKDDDIVKQKILAAKFGYVKSNQEDGGEYFETYLNELVDAHYDGAQSIYNQYYAWHLNIVTNNLEDDFSTDMKNLNRHDTIYFHTTVTGGAPGGSVRLYYQVIWPDGTAEKKDIENSWHAGSHFSSRFQYAMPLFSKEGKLKFEIYDKDSHDLLGTDSVQLKK